MSMTSLSSRISIFRRRISRYTFVLRASSSGFGKGSSGDVMSPMSNSILANLASITSTRRRNLENRRLREDIRLRKEASDIGDRLIVNDNAYFLTRTEQELPDDGPFCMTCWDTERKLVRERKGATEGTHFCAYCRSGRSSR
jgi:hypothetical protein